MFIWLQRLVFLLFSGLLFSSLCLAEQKAISLDYAIALTIEYNPALVSFGYQFQIQEGLIRQAALPSNPTLNLEFENFLGTGGVNGFDSMETTLSISWVLENAVRKQNVNVAQAGISLLNSDSEIARIDAATETARRFLASLAQQARLASEKKVIEVDLKTIDAIKRKVQIGRAPKVELAIARANLARKKLQLGDIEHDLETSYYRLAAQWGEVKPNFKSVTGNLYSMPEVESFDELKQRITQNPEFERLLSQQRITEAELQLTKTLSKPQWQLRAGVRRLEQQRDQAFVFDFSVPLTFNNKNQGKIAASQAQIEKINADANVIEVSIHTQLFELHQEFSHSVHRATTIRDDVIPTIGQAAKDAKDAYELGRFSYLEWQNIEKNLLTTKQDLLEAMINAHSYVIEIERITGVPVTKK